MNDKIINFFKFLEVKKGTQTPFLLKITTPGKFKFTKKDLYVDDFDWVLDMYEEIVFPDNLTIDGVLDLRGTNIKKLPNNLTVLGTLYLNNTVVDELPRGLKVKDFLYIQGLDIKTIPNDIEVGKVCNIRNTQIKTLDDNLKIPIFWVPPTERNKWEREYPQYKFS
jgi:hypothetical protein